MIASFTIVRLGALDLERAASLHAESFALLGERGWTRRDLAELIASPGVTGLLLRTGDEDAGFALCRVAAEEAELLTIAVRPCHRRHGGGRYLLAGVIDHVRENGARALFLEVGADNPPARSLYESQGFCAVGRRAGYYRRGEGTPADAVVMRRSLK